MTDGIDALLALPAHVRERLASALETGQLGPPYTPASLRSTLGQVDGADAIRSALASLGGGGGAGAVGDRGSSDNRPGGGGQSGGVAVARVLRALGRARDAVQRPDLVWSGPEVPGLHARDTRRVFEELVASAERSLWISTYAFFDGPRAFDALARRMDERPELHVRLLLNIQRRRADTTAVEHLVRAFAERFWSKDWPGQARPAVYYDPRALGLDDGPGAVLHAKAVVCDDATVLVTSANLTEAAFDRNIELGLLVRDRALAATVSAHFRVLVERGLLKALPGG